MPTTDEDLTAALFRLGWRYDPADPWRPWLHASGARCDEDEAAAMAEEATGDASHAE